MSRPPLTLAGLLADPMLADGRLGHLHGAPAVGGIDPIQHATDSAALCAELAEALDGDRFSLGELARLTVALAPVAMPSALRVRHYKSARGFLVDGRHASPPRSPVTLYRASSRDAAPSASWTGSRRVAVDLYLPAHQRGDVTARVWRTDAPPSALLGRLAVDDEWIVDPAELGAVVAEDQATHPAGPAGPAVDRRAVAPSLGLSARQLWGRRSGLSVLGPLGL